MTLEVEFYGNSKYDDYWDLAADDYYAFALSILILELNLT